ncbi:MAG: pyrimidine reductase family protein [Beutenbergiaceae bacterium]
MFNRSDLIDQYAVPGQRPYLRANMIASLDGAATIGGLSGGLNDAWDKQVFDTLRMLADVVIVGSGTLLAEGYGPLELDQGAVAWRRERGLADHPVLAIVTGSLSMSPDHPMLAAAPIRPVILTHAGASRARRAALAAVADVLECGPNSVDLSTAKAALADRGLVHQLCEGGPTVLGQAFAADVVDELCLTMAPIVTAGDAPRIATSPVASPHRMELMHVLSGGPMLFLRYQRDRTSES